MLLALFAMFSYTYTHLPHVRSCSLYVLLHFQLNGVSRKTWGRNYKSSETETLPDMNTLMSKLPVLLPPSSEARTSLVHGDYRIDNVIFSDTAGEMCVDAVLDWELSTLGDGLADLAYVR